MLFVQFPKLRKQSLEAYLSPPRLRLDLAGQGRRKTETDDLPIFGAGGFYGARHAAIVVDSSTTVKTPCGERGHGLSASLTRRRAQILL